MTGARFKSLVCSCFEGFYVSFLGFCCGALEQGALGCLCGAWVGAYLGAVRVLFFSCAVTIFLALVRSKW